MVEERATDVMIMGFYNENRQSFVAINIFDTFKVGFLFHSAHSCPVVVRCHRGHSATQSVNPGQMRVKSDMASCTAIWLLNPLRYTCSKPKLCVFR